ncbi:CoA-transferase family III [Leucogyrophana mollusca]|uniref:CoA-transferase family III n=1 Tax=Leucogyrophana mollusca TaxID=85980 RepID=A0ACB8B4E7_9AGAM|nr:CoA-transferase family III [Leucogyrophana mollusca]
MYLLSAELVVHSWPVAFGRSIPKSLFSGHWSTPRSPAFIRPTNRSIRRRSTMTATDSQDRARALWLENGLPPEMLSHLNLSKNPNSAIDSSFKIASAAQTSIGLSGLAAAYFHSLRTGVTQDVTVDARHAILDISSEFWYTVDGELPKPDSIWDPLAGIYKTKDDSYVRLHTNFPHHRDGLLKILRCDATREAVQKELLKWNAEEFETQAALARMCASAFRSFEEWDKHPQAIALLNTPPVSLVKIGDAPRRVVAGEVNSPLENIRVLDLCRVLSGPICGRTLAAHGADVLLVTSPQLPALPLLDVDTSRGKRTTQLDLTLSSDRDTLATLVKDADVFLQAYRPGGLREKGFGPQDLAKVRPGIVCANLTAYGWEGPWKDRRGFDSLVQTATGFNWAEAEAHAAFSGKLFEGRPVPRPFPLQALDHVGGYLLAFGINAALAKTITEGGSWEVRVSLAAVGQWLRSMGQLSPQAAFGDGKPLPPRTIPQHPEVAALVVTSREALGDKRDASEALRAMTGISQSAILSKTPVREVDAPMGLDRNDPVWLQ